MGLAGNFRCKNLDVLISSTLMLKISAVGAQSVLLKNKWNRGDLLVVFQTV